jgi:hypothetical protein
MVGNRVNGAKDDIEAKSDSPRRVAMTADGLP